MVADADEITTEFEQHVLLPLNLSGTLPKLSAPQHVVYYDPEEFGADVFNKTVCQVHVHKTPVNWANPLVPAPGEALSEGSGFVVNAFGSEVVIVTNEHVVHDAAVAADEGAISVTFPINGNNVRVPVQLLATCPEADLAILKISKRYAKEHMPWFGTEVLALGDSSAHYKGEEVYVVGYPLGQSGQALTKGVFSTWQHINDRWYIFTDAAINHGNSGGPFMIMTKDNKFEVIGVNTAIVEGAQNAGYVTPVESVKTFLHNFQYMYAEEKRKNKRVATPVFIPLPVVGMRLEAMTPTLQKFKGSSTTNGLFVSYIADGSLFAAGHDKSHRLINEDQIVAVNGTPIDNAGQVIPKGSRIPTDLSRIISAMGFGEKINFTIIRNGAVGPIEVELTYYPADPRIVKPVYSLNTPELPIAVVNGMMLQNLNLNLVEQLRQFNPMLNEWVDIGAQCEKTCVVCSARLSVEANARLNTDGLILKKVDGKKVTSLSDVNEIMGRSGKEFHRFDFAPGGQSFIFETRKMLALHKGGVEIDTIGSSIISNSSIFKYVDIETTRFDRSECEHEPGYCNCKNEAKLMSAQLRALISNCSAENISNNNNEKKKSNKKQPPGRKNLAKEPVAAHCSQLELEELQRLLPQEVLYELGYLS